jgi:hypothetical protein
VPKELRGEFAQAHPSCSKAVLARHFHAVSAPTSSYRSRAFFPSGVGLESGKGGIHGNHVPVDEPSTASTVDIILQCRCQIPSAHFQNNDLITASLGDEQRTLNRIKLVGRSTMPFSDRSSRTADA